MNQNLSIKSGEFEQAQRAPRNFFWVTPAALLAVYYLYVLFNGWGVEVVEFRPTHCALVSYLDSPYFNYRSEGILELKSKTASLGADTLYAPHPREAPYGVSSEGERYVYVPAWAYRCQS